MSIFLYQTCIADVCTFTGTCRSCPKYIYRLLVHVLSTGHEPKSLTKLEILFRNLFQILSFLKNNEECTQLFFSLENVNKFSRCLKSLFTCLYWITFIYLNSSLIFSTNNSKIVNAEKILNFLTGWNGKCQQFRKWDRFVFLPCFIIHLRGKWVKQKITSVCCPQKLGSGLFLRKVKERPKI